MKKEEFDFWQDHSTNYLKMAFGHDHQEIIHNPDGVGERTGECGDTVKIFLSVNSGIIQAVSFDNNGCLNTNACANAVAILIEGRSLSKAWKLTPEDVAGYLKTLPKDHFHCAELVVGALYLALSSANEADKTSWKKLYRK